nr:hypothetical protein HK105_002965 [Polyrhizophydium stewartii]
MSVKIRALFDAGRDISNPHEIRAALMNTERILAANVHPTPFIQPTGYGGTKYERNVPVPEEVLRRGVVPVDNYQ